MMSPRQERELFGEVQRLVDWLAIGDEEARRFVRDSSSLSAVTRLPGDASTRRYYRLESEGERYILMKIDPFPEQGGRLDFLEMQEHLVSAGIDVPRVLASDAHRGFILLEDLGDVTLLRKLQEVCTPEVERHLYERVIDSVVDLQVKASPKGKPSGVQAYGLFFDHKKLMWEVNFTIEHFYQTYLARKMGEEDLRVLIEGFSEICDRLAAEPVVLAHRDFHSRNIMITPDDRLVMIDFQDARLGPKQYDLASLLKDSYYQLEEAQVDRLIDYYIARYEAVGGERLDRAAFREVFDLMGVQRNFKAIGSFASFLNRRGNATYLKYIGNTFENIRRALLRHPRYSRLREVLFHYYYF